MNIVVTGANGFIGQHFCQSFKPRYTIHRINHNNNYYVEHDTFHLDLSNKKHVRLLISDLQRKHVNIDYLFHFACSTPNHNSYKSVTGKSVDLRIAHHIKLLSSALHVRRLVFTSGWVVYSDLAKVPIKETSPLRPSSNYGKTKLSVERYFKRYVNTSIFINLRLSSVYGSGLTYRGLIPNLTKAALQEHAMKIQAVNTKRDYLYIDDLIRVFEKIIKQPPKDNIDCNIGSGSSHSVLEITQMLQKIFSEKFQKKIRLIMTSPLIESSCLDNVLDITKATNLFRLKKSTGLYTGLTCYIQWLLTQS